MMIGWRTPVLLIAGCGLGAAQANPVSFRRDVVLILQKRCIRCHSGDTPKGQLDLTSRPRLLAGGVSGPAVVPGKPSASLLLGMVADKKMPPKEPLAPESQALLRRWIEEGAVWEGGNLEASPAAAPMRAGPDWWSLQPIRRPKIPLPDHPEWGENPIDAFVLGALGRKGLTPSPEADRRTLIRRVSLDLTGLWPTPAEVDAFLVDQSPGAFERVVDRLLASPASGERWARHWLDVVRFAESHGYEMNTLRPNAWPYRDWVIRAFNQDLPFSAFVREQLAGDVIDNADPLTQAATGFLVGGPHDLVGNQTEEGKRQQRSDDLYDMVSATGATFLGLTVNCARCHDHKFDPISQRDYYALEAMFAGVEHAERPVASGHTEQRRQELAAAKARLAVLDQRLEGLEPVAVPEPTGQATRPPVNPRRNVDRIVPVETRFVRFTIRATSDGTQPCLDEIEVYGEDRSLGNLARSGRATASSEYPGTAIHKIAHLNDGLHGNGKSWISNEPGKGWAQIEFPRPVRIERVVWARDRNQQYRDRLPTDYQIDVSMDGKAWSRVAGSWDRGKNYQAPPEVRRSQGERDELESRVAALEKPMMVYAGNFRTPDPTFLLKRGDVMRPGEPIVPATIQGIGSDLRLAADTPGPSRRRALADWIVAPNNPLPARVMVNRIWQGHFGHGLVRTPSDFGFNGDRPSHPDLLDWLASEFQANGGRVKPLHRMIVLSRTYRQSSQIDTVRRELDAENRFLWRFPSRRIEAEAVRDNVLQATGALNRAAGGPGYHLWTYSNYVTVFTPKPTLGPEEFRRMVYQFKPRTQQDGTFGVFDCPDATIAVPRRLTSTTALQALNLLNDPFIHDQADRFAARLRDAADDPVSQVANGFRLAFQRDPSRREAEAASRLVEEFGLAPFCRMLLNANEFVTLE